MKHMSVILAGFVVVLLHSSAIASSEDEVITPRVEPAAVCNTTPMTIIHDQEEKFALGIRGPDGRLIYVADHVTVTLLPLYWQGDEIYFRADQLYGMDYVDGGPVLRKVFVELGSYEFIFSDNLHTEIENSVTITQKVTFFSKDHPDCPKFP